MPEQQLPVLALMQSHHCLLLGPTMDPAADHSTVNFAAGVPEQQLPKLVEEQMEHNRKVRARGQRRKQGLPPIRRRRTPSQVAKDPCPRSSKGRAQRRQQEQASRVDDGELGPGFAARQPPR